MALPNIPIRTLNKPCRNTSRPIPRRSPGFNFSAKIEFLTVKKQFRISFETMRHERGMKMINAINVVAIKDGVVDEIFTFLPEEKEQAEAKFFELCEEKVSNWSDY